MKIYFSHARASDFKKELYEPLKKSVLAKEHELVFPHEKSEELFDTKKNLKNCGLVIAECSYPKLGVGIEIGWADIYNIPVIACYKKGAKESNSVNAIAKTIVRYGNEKELMEKIADAVRKTKGK
jgi:hypothetical protein